MQTDGRTSLIKNKLTTKAVAGISYVTKMALIQGHLWVAAQLVDAEEMDLGAKHAKHPAQEVYQELLPFFHAYRVFRFR